MTEVPKLRNVDLFLNKSPTVRMTTSGRERRVLSSWPAEFTGCSACAWPAACPYLLFTSRTDPRAKVVYSREIRVEEGLKIKAPQE